MGLVLGLVAFNGWAWTQLQPEPLGSIQPPELVTLSAESCASCHAEIYEEWRGSRMAHAATGAVFDADFTLQGRPFVCLRCHAPLPEQQPTDVFGLAWFKPLVPIERANPQYDAELAHEGVTCTVCHLAEGGIRGAAGTVQAPHPVVHTDAADLNQACARCHQLDAPPLSNLVRPISDTVAEWQRWRDSTGRTESCVDCHMPEVVRPIALGTDPKPGHRHHFPGAWNDAYVASGLRLTEPTRTGDTVSLTVENLAGHRLPSGEPVRALLVQAQSGDRVETVVIGRELDGYRDVSDTTLAPGEARLVSLPVDPGPVDIRVIFDRLYFGPELQPSAPDHRVELAHYRL